MDLRKSGSHSQRPTAGLGDTKNKNADSTRGKVLSFVLLGAWVPSFYCLEV